MRTIRASRVDYYTQHDTGAWLDQLGSLSLGGENCVFVNLAGIAGPDKTAVRVFDAMMDVNYRAPLAAAKACADLEFGHWIQSSTQATKAERAGQVPYSRGNAMIDFALSRITELPVTIACLGLLYSQSDGVVGQVGDKLNLVDLAKLPLTPIMGDGRAPLQPQEVCDAAERIAFLALSDPSVRPIQRQQKTELHGNLRSYTLRMYDAVGPETLSLEEVLRKFALYQGVSHFRPVHIDYRNMELLLNVASLGNLNRQFVSLLRSEQSAVSPSLGDPSVWSLLLGGTSKLLTLDEAFVGRRSRRRFPYAATARWVWENPRVVFPGVRLVGETLRNYLLRPRPNRTNSAMSAPSTSSSSSSTS